MNKIIIFIISLLILVSTPMSRVLVLVDEWYRDYDVLHGNKITRYMAAVKTKDLKDTARVILYRRSMYDCFEVWQILRDTCNKYHATANPLEGVVLVGDIPVPTFHVADNPPFCGPKTIACDYFYMDLWDSRAGKNCIYPNWLQPGGPWTRYNGEYYTLDRNNYQGDRKLDIWVSRIYATTLKHLRAEGAPFGTNLEEYQIISAYFDKVNKRMTTPVTTRRSLGMGHPPGFPNKLSWYAALGKLNLGVTPVYYDDSTTNDLKLNQAAAWQALLQSGKPGNSNYGSYQGTRYTDSMYLRNCQTGLTTGNYEWAAFFAHSTPELSFFQGYPAGSMYRPGGTFFNVNNSPAWTVKTTGGYNGKYYEWNNPYSGKYQVGAEWSCVIPVGRGGIYQVYMYWDVVEGYNSPNSYYNLLGNKNFDVVAGGILDQTTTASDKWNYISQFPAARGDSLVFQFVPNHIAYTRSYRCVADAIQFRMASAEDWVVGKAYTVGYYVNCREERFRCLVAHTSSTATKPTITPNTKWVLDYTPYSITITPSDIFSVSSRGTKGFRCTNWYDRSFCDMQDEPGKQSKVLFFELIGCEISNIRIEDNLGLLYGMGHAGLTSIGNSYPNYGDNDFTEYATYLGSTSPVRNFGDAYLYYANRDFPVFQDNFILVGAGTLKAKSY